MTPLDVKIGNSICQIPEAAWNAIAGAELCYSHRWQLLMENHLYGFFPQYILLSRNERPLAAAILMIPPPPYFFMKNLPPIVQPFFERAVGKIFAFCALPFNFRLNGIILTPDVTNNPEILTSLLDTLNQQASQRKRLIQVYLSAEGTDATLHQVFAQRGYVSIPASSYAILPMKPWQTFADYLQDLPRKKRKEIRRERRRAQERDVTIQCMRPTELDVPDTTLYQMFCNIMAHHNAMHPWLDVGFFATIRSQLAENAFYFLARVQDKPIGFILGLHDQNTINFQIIGLDYDIAREHGVYFLLQYAAIEQAIHYGFKNVYMGTTTLDVKQRLGYQVCHRHYFFRSSNPILDRTLQFLLRHSQTAADKWLGKDL